MAIIHQIIKTYLERSSLEHSAIFQDGTYILSKIMMAKQNIFVIKEPGLQTLSRNQLELREEELNQNHKQRIAKDLEDT